MVFPPQPSDSLILVSWPCPEGHFSIFSAIQAYLFRTFHLAVDSLGLRRSGSSSQFIDPPQDFPKQVPRHGDFGQLERDVPGMAHDLGPDLDQLLAQGGQRSVLWLLRYGRLLLWVTSRPHGHCVDTSVPRAEADVIGGKADVEIEGLLSARERTFSRQAQKVRL